jgi:hypothetical protein
VSFGDQQIGQRDRQGVKAGLDRIRLVHSPIDDAARQRADDDVGQRLGIVPDADLAARHAVLDELEKRVVQGETTLNAVPRGGQHLGDHLTIGIAAGALVPQGVVVPLRSLVAGVPGSV